ncbi:MAG: hemolysin III family protein [Clostridia bacterium]|nr:hemolysin III family protein [Clostridia bacterium]
MKRTKLKDRILPPYTRGEEIFNMVSHIAGGGLGVIMASLCIIKAFINFDAYQIVGAFIYGISMVVLYTMSSIYHGLVPVTAKKVFQIIDHCAIFILIAGTYTPIALCNLREYNAIIGWGLCGFVWAMAILGVVFNAIDLKKYSVFSNVCYIAVGWCVLFVLKPLLNAMQAAGFWWLLAGGIAYTIGAIFYAVAAKKKTKYIHSVFHLFVVVGSVLQFVSVFFYVLV